jgi:uncharacterized cupin superfamily protein
MNTVSDATNAQLEWSELSAGQCPDGSITTGLAYVAESAFAQVGVWEHPQGTSTDVEQEEVFVVLSGSGRVILQDGTELVLKPGTVGVLAAGTPTTWIIDEPLRKVWIAPR